MIERRPLNRSFAAALVVLTAAGVVGNALGVPLFFGVDFLLGSIATLIVARLYGPAWGTLSAAIASAYTLVLWQHPYAALIFTLEALVVGLLARGGRRNLFQADGLFWLLAGVPLVWLFYGTVLRVGPDQTWLVALKDAVNGTFNALIAGLIVEHAVLARRAREPGWSAVPFRRILFNVLAALVLFPAMLLLVLDSDREARAVEQAIAAQLRNDAREITEQLRRWQERRLHALRELAAIAGPSPRPSAPLQDAAEVVQRAVPDFRVVGVTDTAGRVVAASPPTTTTGRPLVGQDYSTRPFFEATRATLRPAVSDVFAGTSGNPVVVLTAPILRDGRLAGLVAATLDMGYLDQLVESLAREGLRAALLDRAGRVVTATGAQLEPAQTYDWRADAEVRPLGDSMHQRLPPGDGIPPMVRWARSRYVLETPVGGDLPWTLVAEIPVAPYQAQLQASQIRTFAILLALAAVTAALALGLAGWLTGSIARLAAVTRDLPRKLLAGEAVAWPSTDVGEVEALIGNFRSMEATLEGKLHELRTAAVELEQRSQALSAANAQVRALNASLESRVAQRTSELEARNTEQETFVYTVSHDLRQPLLALEGMSELLREALRDGDAAEAEYLIGRVQQNTRTMGQLLNDLLSLSRVGRAAEPAEPLDLGELVRAVATELEPRLAARGVDLRLAADWPTVCYPPTELYQALANLLGNAAKFAGRPGERPVVAATWTSLDDRVTLRVSDNGPGIEPAYREKVFGLFQKLDAKAEGTGVGLAIVKRIAERHGGSVWVEDSQLGGATLALSLPLAERADGSLPAGRERSTTVGG